MSNLPEWISGSRIDGAYIDQLQDALVIALEALNNFKEDVRVEYKDEHIDYPLKDAMRRIAQLGDVSQGTTTKPEAE